MALPNTCTAERPMITLTATEEARQQCFATAEKGARYWRAGKHDKSRDHFSKAIAEIEGIRYVGYNKDALRSLREHDLKIVVQTQADCGACDEALALLKRLSLPSPRFYALMPLAPALVHAGQAARAETLVRNHSHADGQAYLKATLAIAYAETGAVKKGVRHIAYLRKRLRSLKRAETSVRCQFAIALAHCGFLDEALQVAAALMDALWRYPAQHGCMPFLVAAGRTDEALRIAREAIRKTMRSEGFQKHECEHHGGIAMMIAIAQALRSAGDRKAGLAVLREARSWADEIYCETRAQILTIIAAGFRDLREADAACEALDAAERNLPDQYWRERTEGLIAAMRAGRSIKTPVELGGPARRLPVRIL
jgi:hypothetical protein